MSHSNCAILTVASRQPAKETILAIKPLGYENIKHGGGRNPLSILAVIRQMEPSLGKQANISGQPTARPK